MSQNDDLPLFQSRAVEEPRHWTVSELTQRIKGVIEPSFSDVWVQGEVSNTRPSSSGHVYFSLKDKDSTLSAAAFSWSRRTKKTFEIRDGMEVLCHGKVSLYGPRGSYQLIVDRIEPLGQGALQVAFEQLKTKLQAEGLFDPKKKRPMPKYPKRIAVITSPSGAALQDILNVLGRRAPNIQVFVLAAMVQGAEAPRQIIDALERAQKLPEIDVVLLARGGGSIEDLWCFNDESLARAIALSKIPTLSAVGHEIDFTIADFVADLRAPTPSAGAEILSAHWMQVIRQLEELDGRLQAAIQRDLKHRSDLLEQCRARLKSPRDRLNERAQKLDEIQVRIDRAWQIHFDRRKSAWEQMVAKLDALSPLKVLSRGYTLLKDPLKDGTMVTSVKQVQPSALFRVVFHDGEAKARWENSSV